MCRPKVWKQKHKEFSECMNAEEWTMSKINHAALEQNQKTSSGMSFASVGARSRALLSCVPLKRALPPMLHLLLGLGNDTCSKFKEFIHSKIEKLYHAEIEVKNVPLLAEIKFDEGLIKLDDLKKEASDLMQQRTEINSSLKERGRTSESKEALR